MNKVCPTSIMNTSTVRASILAVLALTLNSCVTPPPPPPAPSAKIHPHRIDKGAAAKTYALTSDWSADGWVIKSGAMISFNADGTGLFEGSIYQVSGPEDRDEVRFQSVQLGKDGNTLFTSPGADTGIGLYIQGLKRERVHTVHFAFDARQFAAIESVTFMARRARAYAPLTPGA